MQHRHYSQVKDSSGRTLYECDSTVRGIDGKLRKCSRRYRRKNIPQICKHIHTILIDERPGPLPTLPPNEEEMPNILTSLALTTCQINLSLRQATSDSLMNLINTAYHEGYRYKQDHPNSKECNIKQFTTNRPYLRQEIIKLSIEREKHSLRELHCVKYVVVAIDNGTIKHRHSKIQWDSLKSPVQTFKGPLVNQISSLSTDINK
jgi:hypothetical protein